VGAGDARRAHGPRAGAGRHAADERQQLRRILESRAAFYSKADEVFDTSEKTMEDAFVGLQEQLRGTISISG
jgi:XRE family aerobic/anaerobic benzoate catabolism transcriptional regulator